MADQIEKKPKHAGPQSGINDATLRGLVGYNMKRAFNVVSADLARTLKPFDLRMLTYTALVLIADNPGLRQSQLADAMDIERPNMVAIINELERRGLISRQKVPEDRRAHALSVTDTGKQLTDLAIKAVTAHEAELFSDHTENEVELIVAAMQRIYRPGRKGQGA